MWTGVLVKIYKNNLEPDIGLNSLYAVIELDNSDEQHVHNGDNAHEININNN